VILITNTVNATKIAIIMLRRLVTFICRRLRNILTYLLTVIFHEPSTMKKSIHELLLFESYTAAKRGADCLLCYELKVNLRSEVFFLLYIFNDDKRFRTSVRWNIQARSMADVCVFYSRRRQRGREISGSRVLFQPGAFSSWILNEINLPGNRRASPDCVTS